MTTLKVKLLALTASIGGPAIMGYGAWISTEDLGERLVLCGLVFTVAAAITTLIVSEWDKRK